ncbi:MAG: transcriptional regulator [Clostridiaceae bacterium]
MEILSTGEKIKRARIKKGFTLKDICKDKISISKMSCIENGKAEAKEWILDYVAQILGLPLDYLKEDVEAQIIKSTAELEEGDELDKKMEVLERNLGYAEEHELYRLAFKLAHMLFNTYLLANEHQKIQRLMPEYYEIWNKSGIKGNEVIYLMDLAGFFYEAGEYAQAESHYKNLRKASKKHKDTNNLARAAFSEAACCVKQNKYDAAYELAIRHEKYIDQMAVDYRKAEACQLLAMLSIRRGETKFSSYEKKTYELFGDSNDHKAEAMYDFGAAMFESSMEEKAIAYIERAMDIYKGNNAEAKAEFMLRCVDILVERGVIETVKEKCYEATELAIASGNLKLIEKGYYQKSVVLEGKRDYQSAIHYIGLSLDTITKIGTNLEIYRRYLQYGVMCHRMDNITEALKYFNLAIRMEKNI